jgi:HEAT repeat protein
LKLDKEKLLQEIRDKNVEINNINDLIYIDKKYKDLVPVILKHLNEISDESDKEFLVRCLGVKGFTEATGVLIDEFEKSPNKSYKWAIANSLYNIMDKSYTNKLVSLAKDKAHSTSRQMIVRALGKTKDESVVPVLVELLEDDDVISHAISALSNFKKVELLKILEPYTHHERTLVRNEAQKAINKISKKQE